MAKRKDIDWAAIETDYRTGTHSIRALAAKHGVSEAAIRKKAGEGGWVRTKCAPSAHVGAHQAEAEILPPLRPRLPPPDERVSVGTALPIEDIGAPDHVRQLAQRLLHELDATTTQMDEVEDAIHEETQGDRSGRRRSAMLKAVSLPARSLTLKTIAQVLELMGDAGATKVGKKEQRQEAAKKAATGKYATPAPPRLAVDNTKG